MCGPANGLGSVLCLSGTGLASVQVKCILLRCGMGVLRVSGVLDSPLVKISLDQTSLLSLSSPDAYGRALGEALFNKILQSPSGTEISLHTYEEHWDLIRHKDKKI